MKDVDVAEQAYKNGYSAGYKAGQRSAVGGDVVSVVRCKDCKYWRDDVLRDDEMKCCSIGFYMTKGSNFCSFGKKRRENNYE